MRANRRDHGNHDPDEETALVRDERRREQAVQADQRGNGRERSGGHEEIDCEPGSLRIERENN